MFVRRIPSLEEEDEEEEEDDKKKSRVRQDTAETSVSYGEYQFAVSLPLPLIRACIHEVSVAELLDQLPNFLVILYQ